MLSTISVMDQDIKSQIIRAKELLNELEKSCVVDLEGKVVSERTKNLTQEILVKMRNVLDQSMYTFFEKNVAPNISCEDKNKARIYFPICRNEAGLRSTLGRGMMSGLEKSHPDIFLFLESYQPYYHDNNAWLEEFSKYSNEKHIQLTPQEVKEENETTISNAVHVGRGAKVVMRNCLVDGVPVDVGDINLTPMERFDPRLKIKRMTWISFNFKDTDINILLLCKKVVSETERLVEVFFTKFRDSIS